MMDVTNYLDRSEKKERERERDLSEKNGEQEAKIQCTLILYWKFLFLETSNSPCKVFQESLSYEEYV